MQAEKEKSTQESSSLEDIFKSGGVVAGKEGEEIHCLSIIGQIEGHYLLGDNQKATKYEHMIPLLVSIEENPHIKGLLVVLNTMGGDVEAGLALAELIASMAKPTVSLVLGGGHSIGVPLAVAAKRSFIVPSATMTIHPVRTTGMVLSAPQSFRALREMQDRILDFTCNHSHVERQVLEEMMMRPDEMATDMGSIIDGKEAVRCGLIDEIGGLSQALASLHEMAK
ncbi:MAG: ATP-dependent Clp protease proteolytic subunit [Clostridia bacterium]|nr:ATP-dependent Clp protease proteolytic subunit [Clostridia bacterium]